MEMKIMVKHRIMAQAQGHVSELWACTLPLQPVGGDMVKTDLRAIQHYKAQDERV
jgi:hypothetical protein